MGACIILFSMAWIMPWPRGLAACGVFGVHFVETPLSLALIPKMMNAEKGDSLLSQDRWWW